MANMLEKERTGLNREVVQTECTLSIMEAALVWELLLASRKAETIAQVAKNCAKNPELIRVLDVKLTRIDSQMIGLESIMKRVGLPVPFARPRQTEKMLFIDDTLIVQEMLSSLYQRIRSLAYLIHSSMTNRPLRLLAACYLTDEMDLLEMLCCCIKTENLVGV